MNLISKLLLKKGIKSEDDLSQEEKESLSRFKAVLTGEKVTVDSLKEFCLTQIKIVEQKFASGENTQAKDAYLKAILHVYLNLVKAIEAPEIERATLERHLQSLINEDKS